MGKAYVVGVGLTKFEKPGQKSGDYPIWVKEATEKALEDAKIDYSVIEKVFVGYIYGDSGCGQRSMQEVGLTGIPIFNVNNNCSAGTSAFNLAKDFVELGRNDCVLVVGFEKMANGGFSAKFSDRTGPLDNHYKAMTHIHGYTENIPNVCQIYGNAGIEHMRTYGTKPEHLAKIAYKNHKHAVNNPYAQYQIEFTLEEILSSKKIFGPLTQLQCCTFSDGAAAVVVASESFATKHNLQSQAIEIVGMETITDLQSTFSDNSCMKLIGYDLTNIAVNRLLTKANRTIEDVQVIELHDCFSTHELIAYEALGLCPPGKAGEFIDRGDNTYGGKYVVNPSGGLISRGHPLGATGVAQCIELCWQLRGEAGKRQVANVKLALQHNAGLGAAIFVALYQKGKFN